MKKSINHKKHITEGSVTNSESIKQLQDQIVKFIEKNKDNPMTIINSLSIGIFLGFSEAFAKDGRPETNGLNMLEKMINKLRVLMKTHDNLIPEPEEEFLLEPEEQENEIQNMVDDLEDNSTEDIEENKELENIYESKKLKTNKRKL